MKWRSSSASNSATRWKIWSRWSPWKSLSEMQEAVKGIFVAPAVKRYIVSLARQTRDHPEVYLGASPRGSLALYRTCPGAGSSQRA